MDDINKTIDTAISIEEIAEIERNLNRQLVKAGWHNVKHVLSDMYKEPSHFIFELLQNAENALANEIKIYLYKDNMVFTHNGAPFSLDDIKRICKAGDINKADTKGKFGIGFKSVYKITKTPFIYSLAENEYSFKIEDFNVPIVVKTEKVNNIGTKFVLPFNTLEKQETTYQIVRDGLGLLNEDAIMFSDYIKKITIYDENELINEISLNNELIGKKDDISFYKLGVANKNEKLHYLLFQKEIMYFDDYKKREVRRNISIAYPDSEYDKEDVTLKTNKLSVLFPTEVRTELRFKIDAPFSTSHTREQVSFTNNDFNQKIIGLALDLYEESILMLKEHKLLNIDLLYYLAIAPKAYMRPEFRKSDYKIYMDFYEKTVEVFNNNELLQSIDGTYIKSSSALLCHDNKLFMEVFTETDLAKLFDGRHKWIDATGIRSARDDELRKFLTDHLNIVDVEFNRVNPKLTEEFFDDKTDQWLMKFYEICLLNINNIMSNPKPIIRNINDKMKVPIIRREAVVFLPSNFVKTNEKAIKKSFLIDETSMKFFKELNIKEARAIDAIKEEWIPLLKSFTKESDLNDTLIEIFTIINNCSDEQKEEIVKELKTLSFFPCETLGGGEIIFSLPKDIYYKNSFFNQVFKGSKAKLVLSKVQDTINNQSWFKEIVEKLGINTELKVIENSSSYYGHLPRKVIDAVESEYSNYDISPQKNQRFNDFDIEYLESVLNNLSVEVLETFWNMLFDISIQNFTAHYLVSFKYSGVSARGRFDSTLIDKLNSEKWVLINGEKLLVNEVTKQEFRNVFRNENSELEQKLNFKISEDISSLSQDTQAKVELTTTRSVDDIREAFKLLDAKKETERLALLKEEYLINVLKTKLNIKLEDKEIEQIKLMDFGSFNTFSNQKIVFEILKKADIGIKQFNAISDLKLEAKKYFEILLKQLLLTNEKKWIATLFKRNKEEMTMSNKLKLSEDMTKYQQYEFDLSAHEETLDIDFNYEEYCYDNEFFRFDEGDPLVNTSEVYNQNLKKFNEMLKTLEINNNSLTAMLNYPSQKSLMYLGELGELLKRYKSFIKEKEEDERKVSVNLDNVSITNVKTFTVDVKESNSDLTGTKIDIEKASAGRTLTGLYAETIVYRYLSERVANISDVEWDSENADVSVNPNGRAGLGYDIKYKKDGMTYFVEVKGTKKPTKIIVSNFSKNEIKFAQRHQDAYQIMICNGALEKNPRIQIIGNVFENHDFIRRIEGNGYVAIPSGYEIYLGIENTEDETIQ